MKKYYLALERGLFQKSIYPLERSVTIGRSSQHEITLVDYAVSRSHAKISLQNNVWVIEDLGSTNGIIFAGERVTEKVLQSGDTFQIGDSTIHFMEKDSLTDINELSNTMKAFEGISKYQSPLLEGYCTKLGFMSLQETLQSTHVFNSLGDKEFSELEAVANLHLFSADQLIIQEGDPGRSTFVILDGRVRVFTKDYDGNEILLSTLGAHEFFGEMSLLTGEPRSSSVATVEESLLSEISYKNMRNLMMRHPEVKDVLLAYSSKRMEDSREKRAEVGTEDRRSHPRLKERLMVRFTVWPTEALPEEMISHTYKGTSSDISLDGAQLAVMGPAMEAFRPGCQLQLEIELPQPWGKVHTLGIIRRLTSGKHTVQIGIEFSDTSTQDNKKLKEFIYGEVHTAV
jgi:CRP-like cAMP-binding protein